MQTDPRVEPDIALIYTASLADVVEVAFERRGDGGRVDFARKDDEEWDRKRKELIERSRRGDQIELLMRAVTFQQHDERPDANFTDFSASALNRMAKSAPGTPFIRGHRLHDEESAGGYCVSCEVEKTEDGTRRLVEEIAVTKPWAVQSLLDGTMRQFSIGARAVGRLADVIECRGCGQNVFACGHAPGEVIETRSGPRTVVWRYRDARMLERWWVLDPAVENTHVTGVLQMARRRMMTMDNDCDIKIALSQAATQPDPVTLERDALKAQVTDLTAALDASKTTISKLTDELATVRKASDVKELEQGITDLLTAGKLAPNGGQVKQIRERLEAGDVASAKALLSFASEAPAVTLASAPAQSTAATPTKNGAPDWVAIFNALPDYIRESAGPAARKNPERYIRSALKTGVLANHGIDLTGIV